MWPLSANSMDYICCLIWLYFEERNVNEILPFTYKTTFFSKQLLEFRGLYTRWVMDPVTAQVSLSYNT